MNTETNLAKQRKAAIAFLETQGGVEKIRFTQEGSLSGFGARCAANAVVTVNGDEYNEISGTERYPVVGSTIPGHRTRRRPRTRDRDRQRCVVRGDRMTATRTRALKQEFQVYYTRLTRSPGFQRVAMVPLRAG